VKSAPHSISTTATVQFVSEVRVRPEGEEGKKDRGEIGLKRRADWPTESRRRNEIEN